MRESERSSKAPGGFAAPAQSERLRRALERLDGLVDWERRARTTRDGRQMKVSIDPARDLLERLGGPQRRMRVVHVAGTKGKGSVASLVAHALLASGRSVGLYSSPHVERVQERVRIDGAEVDDERFAVGLERALAAREAAHEERTAGIDATWFDVMTAAGLDAMASAGVAWAVVECGLGGRLDSTNAVDGEVCVITNIGLEHTDILGTTREAIAAEKAGILVPGVPCVTGVADDEAGRVIAARCAELGCELVRVELDSVHTIEETNVALAAAVLRVFERQGLDGAAEALSDPETLEAARLPGRLERRSVAGRTVVLDGAHVPESLERVLDELTGPGGRMHGRPAPVMVFAVGQDKDVAQLLKVAAGRVDRLICTSLDGGQKLPAGELTERARALGLPAEGHDEPEEALRRALANIPQLGWVLGTGSLHLAGALRGLTHPDPWPPNP